MTRRALALLGLGVMVACGARVSQNENGTDDGGGASSSSGGSSSGISSSGGSSSGIIGVGSSSSSSGGRGGSSSGIIGSSSGVAPNEDGGQPGTPANLVVVHAAPGLGPFRLCLAVSAGGAANVTPLPGLPDVPGWSGGGAIPPSPNGLTAAAGTPGVYPGTIQALPSFGTSLAAIALTPFVVDATAISQDVNFDGGLGVGPDGGAEETCLALIGSHGTGAGDSPVAGRLVPGVDYWQLPTVPANTFHDGSNYLLAVTGCAPNYEVSDASVHEGITPVGSCGATFTLNGNLSLLVNELDTTTVVTGLGVQFVNLATPLQDNAVPYSGSLTHPPASDGVVPGYLSSDGTFTMTGAPATVETAGTALSAPVSIPAEPDGGLDVTSFGALTRPGSDDAGASNLLSYPGAHPSPGASGFVSGDLLALPLSEIATMSKWNASTAVAATSFLPGQTYTLILLGNNDPSIPQIIDPDLDLNPNTYDGRGMHFVAFPNQFTPIPLP